MQDQRGADQVTGWEGHVEWGALAPRHRLWTLILEHRLAATRALRDEFPRLDNALQAPAALAFHINRL